MSEVIFLTPFVLVTLGREAAAMKSSLMIPGVLLVVMGLIWFLQGINILPGSFMTGQTKWAVIGGVSIAVGVGLIVVPRLMR